jgi:hypothetical protein
MAGPPRRWLALVAGAAGLGVAWLAFPAAAPLYDGVGFPDEPYGYVSRPAGNAVVTKPPTSAVVDRLPVVAGGTTQSIDFASSEQGPQIIVQVPTGTLYAPAGARTVDVRADPRAPDGVVDGQKLDGNVYRITATSALGAPTMRMGRRKVLVVMRATTGRQPGPVMVFRDVRGQQWTRLATSREGTDIYAAPARGFGDYALVFGLPAARPTAGATKAAGKGRAGILGGVLIVGGLVVVLAVIVGTIRISRTGRAP